MRILLTNDDGYHAPGLAVLERIAAALSDDVWVVAPAEEQSGTGRALTITKPVRVRRFGERRFAVAGTHLDLAESPRLDHVGELRETVQRFADDVPWVLGGDVNDVPGSPTWAALGAGRTDVFAAVGRGPGETIGVNRPTRRIDALFADPAVTPVDAWVPDSDDVRRASDHRPLVADLDLP